MHPDFSATAFSPGSSLLRTIVRTQRRRLGVATVAGTLGALFGFVPFLVAHQLVANAAQFDAGTMTLLAAATALALALKWACRGVASRVGHAAAYIALYRLRLGIAEALARQPLGAVQEIGAGRMKKILHDDVEMLELFLAHHIAEITAATCVSLLVVGLLAVLDWRLALAGVAPLALAAAAQFGIYRRYGSLARGYHDAQEKMDARTAEYVRAMPTIKTLAATTSVLDALRSSIRAYDAYVAQWARRWYVPWTAFSVMVVSGFAATLAAGAWLLSEQKIGVAELSLAVLLAGAVAPSVMKLLHFPEVFARLSEADRRVAGLLKTPPLPVADHPRQPAGADVLLRRVRFRYADRWVFDGLDLSAASGEMTALVGPSGAGKSTLIHLVARFWDVADGEIRIGGVDVREILPAVLYRQVSIMRQTTMLFDGTILDNIRMARPSASDTEVRDAVEAAGLGSVLERLPEGGQVRVGDAGTRLSGGERQRIGLARTLLRGAPIILLDEPTAFADAETEAIMLQGIRRLRRTHTLIVAAHRLSTVAEADRIIVLDQGRVLAEGGHLQLLDACPLYAGLWQTASSVGGWQLRRAS